MTITVFFLNVSGETLLKISIRLIISLVMDIQRNIGLLNAKFDFNFGRRK